LSSPEEVAVRFQAVAVGLVDLEQVQAFRSQQARITQLLLVAVALEALLLFRELMAATPYLALLLQQVVAARVHLVVLHHQQPEEMAVLVVAVVLLALPGREA